MTDIATTARESASHCEAKKHALRQTQDGIVVAFVLHPNDVPASLQLAPLGTRYMLALVEIDENEQPKPTWSTKLAVQQTAQIETPAQAAPDLPNKPPVRPIYSQQAGYLCTSISFWNYLKERMPDAWKWSRGPEDQPTPANSVRAAKIVRRYCHVESRKDILRGTEAENRWLLLVSSYNAWRDAARMGAA